jgi:hypothetical protein
MLRGERFENVEDGQITDEPSKIKDTQVHSEDGPMF